MEYNDIYDIDGNPTGGVHRRGAPWKKGEYGLVVCVWVHDGCGNILMTRRAPQKSFAGTWENSGGAVRAGEQSRKAIARELFEETGISAQPEEFEFLSADRDEHLHFHFYCLKRQMQQTKITLQPGETDDAKWVTFSQIHEMIRRGEICKVIARQFLRQEQDLRLRQNQPLQPLNLG